MNQTLIIGNRNYSSWSLRGYLPLAAAGIDFDVTVIPLDTATSKAELAEQSPTGLVPTLVTEDGPIWESLAIAEHAAESERSLWPSEPYQRALARSFCAEMHAGFAALRRDMPMNIRGRHPGVGHSPEALADAARVMSMWRELLDRSGGPFLFGGAFTITDAMYAPVATRFVTYGVELPGGLPTYVETLMEFPPMAAWIAAAKDEPWTIDVAEPESSRWAGGPLA